MGPQELGKKLKSGTDFLVLPFLTLIALKLMTYPWQAKVLHLRVESSPPNFHSLLPLLSLLFLAFVFYIFARRMGELGRRGELLVLFTFVLLALFIQLTFLRANASLPHPTWWKLGLKLSDPTYYHIALRIFEDGSMIEFLRHYTIMQFDWTIYGIQIYSPFGLSAHPPGAIALLYFLMKLFGSDQAMVIVGMAAVVALALVPTYFLAKVLYGYPASLYSAILFLYIPGWVFYGHEIDALSLFPILSAVLFLTLATKRRSRGYALLGGLAYSAALFLNFINIILLAFIGTWGILKARDKDMLKFFLAFAYGVFVPLALIYIFFDYSYLQSLSQAEAGGAKISTLPWNTKFGYNPGTPFLHGDNAYFAWIFLNLYQFFIFIGIPIVCLFFWRIIKNLNLKSFKDHHGQFLIALLVLILALDFRGHLWGGEVTRTWLFLIPMVIVVASGELKERRYADKLVLLVLILQFLQTLAYGVFYK